VGWCRTMPVCCSSFLGRNVISSSMHCFCILRLSNISIDLCMLFYDKSPGRGVCVQFHCPPLSYLHKALEQGIFNTIPSGLSSGMQLIKGIDKYCKDVSQLRNHICTRRLFGRPTWPWPNTTSKPVMLEMLWGTC
jgi:hypothetical protein